VATGTVVGFGFVVAVGAVVDVADGALMVPVVAELLHADRTTTIAASAWACVSGPRARQRTVV
jgi:hypothetical protein